MAQSGFAPMKVKKGVGQYLDKTDNPTFEEWMDRVAKVMVYARGVHPLDLPDQLWRDWYDERLRPIRAANRALRNIDNE